MVSSILSLQSAAIEKATHDPEIQEWLHERGWELAAPDADWHYWHLELGNGSILPVTQRLLVRLYLKDHPQAGFLL